MVYYFINCFFLAHQSSFSGVHFLFPLPSLEMDTLKIVKSKPIDAAQAVKQMERIIAREMDAKQEEDDVTNTTRARISEDVLTQIEIACRAVKDTIPEEKPAEMW